MIRLLGLWMLVLSMGCAQQMTATATPELAESYVTMGHEYLQQNHRSAARGAFRQAISINPNLGSAFLGLALVFEGDGEVSLAEDYFLKAIALNSQPAFAHAYGQFLLGQERFAESGHFLQQAASDVDYLGRAMAFEDFAMLQLYEGHSEQAQSAFSRAVQLDPALPVARWHLSRLAFEQGELMLALSHYEILEDLMAAQVIPHSDQTLQLGIALSKGINDDAMEQRLLEQLQRIQLDQP